MSEYQALWWFFFGFLMMPFIVGGIVLGRELWLRWRHPDDSSPL